MLFRAARERTRRSALSEFACDDAPARCRSDCALRRHAQCAHPSLIAVRKITSTDFRGADKSAIDYVTRRFNASSAGLKKPVGLDLRWDTALRDLQIQLEP